MKICQRCEVPLRFEPGKGWLHPGGGMYVQRCQKCGWMGDGPSLGECPECHSSKDLVDDHCVLPVEGNK